MQAWARAIGARFCWAWDWAFVGLYSNQLLPKTLNSHLPYPTQNAPSYQLNQQHFLLFSLTPDSLLFLLLTFTFFNLLTFLLFLSLPF